jgi:thiol-disulfide isomerase/thioredoxin
MWIVLGLVVLIIVVLVYLDKEYFGDYLWQRLPIRNGVNRVILFGSQDCPVCQTLRATVLPRLVNDFPNIQFEYIDCFASKAVAMQYGIYSYPTIIFVRSDVPEVYSGGWTYEEIAGTL